jgi:hypothetical protein
MMIRAEVSLFCLSYVFGPFIGWKRQPIIYGLLEDLCRLIFSEGVGFAPFGAKRRHGGWVLKLSLSPVFFADYNNGLFTAIGSPFLLGFSARVARCFRERLRVVHGHLPVLYHDNYFIVPRLNFLHHFPLIGYFPSIIFDL